MMLSVKRLVSSPSAGIVGAGNIRLVSSGISTTWLTWVVGVDSGSSCDSGLSNCGPASSNCSSDSCDCDARPLRILSTFSIGSSVMLAKVMMMATCTTRLTSQLGAAPPHQRPRGFVAGTANSSGTFTSGSLCGLCPEPDRGAADTSDEDDFELCGPILEASAFWSS